MAMHRGSSSRKYSISEMLNYLLVPILTADLCPNLLRSQVWGGWGVAQNIYSVIRNNIIRMWNYKRIRRLWEASRELHPSELILVVGKSAEIVITDRLQFIACSHWDCTERSDAKLTRWKVFWNMENHLTQIMKGFRKFHCPSWMVIKKHGMTKIAQNLYWT